MLCFAFGSAAKTDVLTSKPVGMGSVNARESKEASSSNVNLGGIGAQVIKVHFDGVARTKEDLLISNVKPIFDVKHFEDLVIKSQDVRNSLRGAFLAQVREQQRDSNEINPPFMEQTHMFINFVLFASNFYKLISICSCWQRFRQGQTTKVFKVDGKLYFFSFVP